MGGKQLPRRFLIVSRQWSVIWMDFFHLPRIAFLVLPRVPLFGLVLWES